MRKLQPMQEAPVEAKRLRHDLPEEWDVMLDYVREFKEYMMAGEDEFIIIAEDMPIPTRGEDYDEEEYPMPTLADVMRLIMREDMTSFWLIAIGKNACSSPPCGSGPVGVARKMLREDLEVEAGRFGKIRGTNRVGFIFTDQAKDPRYTPLITQGILRLSQTPTHIAAFAIRRLS